ncbi:hypothetical protein AB1Y20_017695 [Prymnesium parvum]|uniref:Uncharacterized protein n=1 Tax=Prymnesium parvum TaxID=97485 RepID=A0AB34JKY5_PRYPA
MLTDDTPLWLVEAEQLLQQLELAPAQQPASHTQSPTPPEHEDNSVAQAKAPTILSRGISNVQHASASWASHSPRKPAVPRRSLSSNDLRHKLASRKDAKGTLTNSTPACEKLGEYQAPQVHKCSARQQKPTYCEEGETVAHTLRRGSYDKLSVHSTGVDVGPPGDLRYKLTALRAEKEATPAKDLRSSRAARRVNMDAGHLTSSNDSTRGKVISFTSDMSEEEIAAAAAAVLSATPRTGKGHRRRSLVDVVR